MRPPSYAKALDRALAPLGFQRNAMDWIRVRGDLWERVTLYASWLGGVTVELSMKDLETEKLFLAALPEQGSMPFEIVRIGELIDNYDRWWGKDDDRDDLVEKVLTYGLPWFDRVRTLEEQALCWYRRDRPDAWHVWLIIQLALTLHRMGETEEACAVLRRQPPKLALPVHIEEVGRVRRWMGCETQNSKS